MYDETIRNKILYDVYEIEMTAKFVITKVRSSAPPVFTPSGSTLWDRFTYSGSFRLPTVNGLSSNFAFANHVLSYDSSTDTFLIGGHINQGLLARINKPALVQHNGTTDNLNIASMITDDFYDIHDGLTTPIPGGHNLGGVAIMGSHIYWLQEPYYNTENTNAPLIGRCDNTQNLQNLNGIGPYNVDRHYKNMSRYITVAPESFADTHLGGKRLICGCSGIAGHQTTSHGPAAIAVETLPPPSETNLLTQNLLFFPFDPYHSFTQHGFPWCGVNRVWDCQWIEDGVNNWLVFIGFYGKDNQNGDFCCYGLSEDCNDPCASYQGYHGYPYVPFLIVYNVEDLMGVITGTEDSWVPPMREIIDLRDIFIRQDDCITWDCALTWEPPNTLWIMEGKGHDEPFDDLPVLHAFDLGA